MTENLIQPNQPATSRPPNKTRTTKKMNLKDIAYQLQTRMEITCREQEETVQAAIALLYEQNAKIEVLTYHLDWINQKEVAQ